jgi:hypothetical protein
LPPHAYSKVDPKPIEAFEVYVLDQLAKHSFLSGQPCEERQHAQLGFTVVDGKVQRISFRPEVPRLGCPYHQRFRFLIVRVHPNTANDPNVIVIVHDHEHGGVDVQRRNDSDAHHGGNGVGFQTQGSFVLQIEIPQGERDEHFLQDGFHETVA